MAHPYTGAQVQARAQIKDLEAGTTLWAPDRAVLGEPQPQEPGVGLTEVSQGRSTVQVMVGHVMGCRGRALGDCMGFIAGCLGESRERDGFR